MSAPDDEPTRRVPPARPRQPAVPPAAGAPLPPEPHVRTWEEELADRISSLKNWVVLLGILSVAALGVAVYALVVANDKDTTSRSSAKQSEINALDRRISDVEDNSASDDSISQIKSDISDLNDKVDKLESKDSGSDSVSAADFADLKQQVSDLSQQVSDLQDQQTP